MIPRQTPVFLDCDTGIDDALALALCLATPSLKLVGVGCVSGNTDAEQATRNTLDLLALAGRSGVPVASGAHDFLTHPYDGGVPHIHGVNGVGNVELPASTQVADTRSAAELLIDLAREYKGSLVVIAVGPLTNLAHAIELEPALPELVKELVIMGGALRVPGNVSPVAEANIAKDPEAARRVFDAKWSITLVPLDVTMRYPIFEEHRRVLLDHPHPFVRTLGEILNLYFDFYTDVFGRRSCALHDPMAVALASRMSSAKRSEQMRVSVDTTDGEGRGQTIECLEPSGNVRAVFELEDELAGRLVQQLVRFY
ncbi:Pyrimidine-specific ribonucleoside hydrolase rihA [Chlamydia trachomatis]|nr:Pyrimidine-specific ribonucleoside hydrolase rihA [Chlamydia trachomatis]CRH90566.1 Pyrimidine-specific ribonucleoside hydrolase rihA [Chlamydia trachomatis]